MNLVFLFFFVCFFFFNDTATTEIYTFSLHDALPICLQVGGTGQLQRARKPEGGRGNSAKIDVAAEIQLENLGLCGAQLNDVGIHAKFEGMVPPGFCESVRELITALDAIYGRIGLAAKIRDSWDIHSDLVATRELRESEVYSAPRELEAEGVDARWARIGLVLEDDSKVARLVVASTRTGILAEDLILRSGR